MKYLILLFILMGLIPVQLWSQVTISSSVDSDELVCPGVSINYLVTIPTGSSICSISWQITRGIGFFDSDDDQASVFITWDDQKPNKVEVEALVSYRSSSGSCTSATSETVKFTHILRSVFQETIPNVGSSVNISYCDTNPIINLSVGPMYIKNTGDPSEPPLTEVELWDWELPSGWRQKTTNNTGQFFTEARAIQIEPINAGGACSDTGTLHLVRVLTDHQSIKYNYFNYYLF